MSTHPRSRRPENVIVQVDDPSAAEVDADDLALAVAAALRAEGRSEAEVTLVVTEDEIVRALNREFRGEDSPTDVLSFPAVEPLSAGPEQATAPHFVAAPEAATYLGDIVIALPFTRWQAAALGHRLADELRLLAIHGTLHLLGYDHADPKAEAAMWARQDAILLTL